MSYDYNALVQNFWKAREEATDKNVESWMAAVEAAETISQVCPMTPLLWLQYAHAAQKLSLGLELEILKLGLVEFPGSAILQLRAVSVAEVSGSDDYLQILEDSIASVGRGSHRNQDGYVKQLYQKWLEATPDNPNKVFAARSRVPMKLGNGTIEEEAQTFLKQQTSSASCESVLAEIETGSRWEARVLGSLAQYDDAVDAALAKQGILDSSASDASVSWDLTLENKSVNMGLGGFEVARAFIQYAKEAQNLRLKKEEEFSTHQLAFQIYERGVAECPTVESLWMNYIIDLTRSPEGLDRLAAVTVRAVRNCPYSTSLAQHRLYATEKLAMNQKVVVDPEELLQVVKDCLDLKFLPPSAPLDLYLSALKVVKRRVMWLLAQQIPTKPKCKPLAYDDAEPLPRKVDKTQTTAWTDDANEELRDLVADLRDVYEDAENQLPKPSAKAELRKDRALTETFMISPLSADPFEPVVASDLLQSFDDAVRAHSPPHPKIYLTYIEQYAVRCSVLHPKDVLTRIRRVRFLYRSAVEKAGLMDDFDKYEYKCALESLGRSWVEWENVFGSERSLFRAKQAIERKFEKLSETLDDIDKDANGSASKTRQRSSNAIGDEPGRPVKKQRTTASAPEGGHALVESRESNDANDTTSVVKAEQPENSVHPFTVRVSNLNFDTQDMDLVDVFRTKCGVIVHARIVRHKDSGKSKGWGLVQFESTASTEQALALDDVIGLGERLLKIEPSQLPAVSLVPPGQHRVNPRGTGKNSKRNDKRRSKKDTLSSVKEQKGKQAPSGTQNNVLSFQPRSVARNNRPKSS